MPSQALSVSAFDLAATLDSGQVFHWHRDGAVFTGLIGEMPVRLEQSGPDTVLVHEGDPDQVSRYLALDHDLSAMHRTLPTADEHLSRALQFAPGIRILRQPQWECLATFITSSLKQVAHIRQISLTIRERFGSPVTSAGGIKLWTYPAPDALAAAGEKALRQCGLGYRAKFLHQTADLIGNGTFDLKAVTALDDEAALLKLCELPGVGPKIAQCTLLFAYERLGVFPIDVWIERALRELYFSRSRRKITPRFLRDFAHKHFGPFRGYAQQWIFHHARTSGIFTRRRKSANPAPSTQQ
jgi:N-glycosylase/DNA lyase